MQELKKCAIIMRGFNIFLFNVDTTNTDFLKKVSERLEELNHIINKVDLLDTFRTSYYWQKVGIIYVTSKRL